jgi:hypothetical protein
MTDALLIWHLFKTQNYFLLVRRLNSNILLNKLFRGGASTKLAVVLKYNKKNYALK